ncbi:hypothetical protein SAMN04488121_103837 [Chitinophaga filiformis]|uniref:Uncharacterized protein n=1 Tax=Chitinophaga filiformis TaxID=104663 RepID=A0A1G7SGB0_CHIFI|nr:hypothetical protein SAMN04488121_103837 [Chitinophaga filiformis]
MAYVKAYLGKEIMQRQAEFKWGNNFLQHLSMI